MNTPEEEAMAKKRFLAMNLVRLSGVVMILVGLLCALDRIDIPGARIVGVLFVIIGMVDTFVVPLLLAKRWRSPRG